MWGVLESNQDDLPALQRDALFLERMFNSKIKKELRLSLTPCYSMWGVLESNQ